MFSYPLQVHPCRASIDAIMNWRPARKPQQGSSDSSPSRNTLLSTSRARGPQTQPEMSEVRFAAITTVLIILSYIVAMTVSSLEKVLAYVGSTGSTTISFILPGLFYYKISDPNSEHHQRLMKEDDDEEDYESDDEEGHGLLSSVVDWKRTKQLRRTLLRKLSLALAIYGFIVMFTCLGVNTFLVAAH